MKTLTKAESYQGHTYRVTLITGREAVLTVEKGDRPAPGGGEVERLIQAAAEKYCLDVLDWDLVELPPCPPPSGERWWAVELKQEFTRVECNWDGSPDCYSDWEHDYLLVKVPCAVWAYSDSAVEKAVADGWQVTGISPSDGPAPWRDEPCPF